MPNQLPSSPNIPDLVPPQFLLPKTNHGIPKPTYKPNSKFKVWHPLSNYVSAKQLLELNKTFKCQLSLVSQS